MTGTTKHFFVSQRDLARVRESNAPPHLRTQIFATLCRINALSMIAHAGSGHIGSSFSSMDIVSWLYLNEMEADKDKRDKCPLFFSSKGHDAPGFYSVLIGCGMLGEEMLTRLRRIEGLPGHPDIGTPNVVTNTGSLGMGISKAKGIAVADRLSGSERRLFVMTGDGELQEGQIWESAIGAASEVFRHVTVIVDHNKLQSDTWVSSTSDLGDLEAKFQAFGWEVARCNGHDTEALEKALEKIRIAPRPGVVIADTIKGRGVSFMEHESLPKDGMYAYHSGAPSAGDYERAIKELLERIETLSEEAALEPPVPNIVPAPARVPALSGVGLVSLVEAYAESIVDLATQEKTLIALDADLLLDTGLVPFKKRFPNRLLECGIAEQDMVSMAGGLALHGHLPVVHSFSCFLSRRPSEQIYNNATERSQIIYSGFLAGLIPAGPGHSHQAVSDISSLASVPGLIMIQPCSAVEVGLALQYAASHEGSTYLRIFSPPHQEIVAPADYALTKGRGVVLSEGTDVIIFGYGPTMLNEAKKATSLLSAEKISVTVVNLPWLNVVDEDWVLELAKEHDLVVALDDHYVVGGQGDMIAGALGRNGSATSVLQIGIESIPQCGTTDEVMVYHRMDATSIASRVVAALRAG